ASGRERRTARTRSVESCPDVIPSRTLPAVPETLSGNAQLPFGAESPPQDRRHSGVIGASLEHRREPVQAAEACFLPSFCSRHGAVGDFASYGFEDQRNQNPSPSGAQDGSHSYRNHTSPMRRAHIRSRISGTTVHYTVV